MWNLLPLWHLLSLLGLESQGRSPWLRTTRRCRLSFPNSQHTARWYFLYFPWLLLPFMSVLGYLSTPHRNSAWGHLLVVVSSFAHLFGVVTFDLPDLGCIHFSGGRPPWFEILGIWVALFLSGSCGSVSFLLSWRLFFPWSSLLTSSGSRICIGSFPSKLPIWSFPRWGSNRGSPLRFHCSYLSKYW